LFVLSIVRWDNVPQDMNLKINEIWI